MINPVELGAASPESWRGVGAGLIVAGLVGEAAIVVIAVASRKIEKTLSVLFTMIIAVGVAIDYQADTALITQANQSADAERAARVELQQRTEWREPTVELEERIADKLKAFSGQQYITSIEYTPESENFAGYLASILKSAGWATHALDIPAPNMSKRQHKPGLEFQFAPSRQADLGHVADAAARAFEAESIAAYSAANPALESQA
jgi:hypothetical protein